MAHIIRRAQAGDIVAFAEIIKEFQPRLTCTIEKMLQDNELTNDVVQETFIKVHEHIRGFNFNNQFSTWIYTIALNLARNHLRRRKRYTEEPIEDYTHTLSIQCRSPHDDAKILLLGKFLQSGIQILPEKYRSAFLMVDHDGKDYLEACLLLGIPIGTVKSRVNRARAILRQYLCTHCPDLLRRFRISPSMTVQAS
ncbi:MAG: sigma-70 family RNA polymerase sigma factor [Patescibacteria group bacterium]